MVLIRKPAMKKKPIRIVGARSEALHRAHRRILVITVTAVLAYVLILARVVDLSVLQGELRRYAQIEEADHNFTYEHERKIRRADIIDRNGVLLATTLETASLYADPEQLPDIQTVARDLVRALPELSYGEVLQKLQSKRRFVWIKRNLTPDEQYEILKLGYPGLKFRDEPRRIYPHGPLAAHIVGYTNVDTKGLSGLEHSFDDFLNDKEAGALTTTIDVRIQHILHRELKASMEHFNGMGAAGIVMDANNGEILAAVSLPDFDPHDPGSADAKQLFSHLTLGVYELGSVFKVFSTAALLETQNVGMGYTFDARKPIKRGRFKISDYHAEKRILTIPEVFIHSSNIGSALMGEKVGTEKLKNFYEDLGLLEPASLEVSEIGMPLVPDPWRDINTLTASYGHGIAVSPLQLTSAVSTIVNGGTLVKPTLIYDRNMASSVNGSSIKSPDLRVISPQTAHRMRQLLRLVVTDGTGEKAAVSGYRVGGKTGTAEKSALDGKGYDRKRLISSFIGAFPMDEPRYVVFAMVDEPKGTKDSFGYATGGWVAAPVVGNVIAGMAPLLGMQPEIQGAGQDMAVSLKRYVHDVDTAGGVNASH